jgi:iron complex transport system ATP-binding protein
MQNSFFEIENFSCGYDDKFTICGINLSIPKGSFAGIIGPNGSGKTTLFKGITSELPALTGAVKLNGKDVKIMSSKEKARHFAVVAQHVDSAFITVEDYVLMGRFPYHSKFQLFETGTDYEIADKYLKLTGVEHLRNKYLNQLSGGEQQLISIARALTQEPELLLLDEPTSHLDITHQVQVLNLVQRLNDQLGLTVLMIIHDLNLAGEYCDQLFMIHNGEIHISGNPEDVLTYRNIEEVYNTVVVVRTNPVSGKPVIFQVSEKILKNMKREKKVGLVSYSF